jgi:hypothetical protein
MIDSGVDNCVEVGYLLKLLLQYENSPFLGEGSLVGAAEAMPLVCSMDSSGDYMCVACGRRAVVFPTSHHTHPLHFMSAVTPAPHELITCVSFIAGYGGGSDDDENFLIVIGTSDGWIQVHYLGGDSSHRQHTCIHRQKVHDGNLLSIDAGNSEYGSNVISIGTVDGIILIDVMDILSSKQWFMKNRDVPDMDARVWEFYTVGARRASLVVSPTIISHGRGKRLYDILGEMNKGQAGWAQDARAGEEARLVISVGKEPPIAFYELRGHRKGRGIVSSIISMSSKMLFGHKKKSADRSHGEESDPMAMVLEREEIDRGNEMRRNGDKKKQIVSDRPKGSLASPCTGVWDDSRRECYGLVVSSSSAWAACCDTLGRVLIIDLRDQYIFKMLKGYRDCQLAWVCGKSPGKDLLIVYAPKRQVLELWDVSTTGTKMKTIGDMITDKGVLISNKCPKNGTSVAFLLDLKSCILHAVVSS